MDRGVELPCVDFVLPQDTSESSGTGVQILPGAHIEGTMYFEGCSIDLTRGWRSTLVPRLLGIDGRAKCRCSSIGIRYLFSK